MSQFRAIYSIHQVLRLDPNEFEAFVAYLFREKGYYTKLTGKSGDRGIDIMLWRDDKNYVVQCKHWKGSVSDVYVRNLLGSHLVAKSDGAFLVTSGVFTLPALKTAQEQSAVLTLVGRDTLMRWVTEVNSRYLPPTLAPTLLRQQESIVTEVNSHYPVPAPRELIQVEPPYQSPIAHTQVEARRYDPDRSKTLVYAPTIDDSKATSSGIRLFMRLGAGALLFVLLLYTFNLLPFGTDVPSSNSPGRIASSPTEARTEATSEPLTPTPDAAVALSTRAPSTRTPRPTSTRRPTITPRSTVPPRATIAPRPPAVIQNQGLSTQREAEARAGELTRDEKGDVNTAMSHLIPMHVAREYFPELTEGLEIPDEQQVWVVSVYIPPTYIPSGVVIHPNKGDSYVHRFFIFEPISGEIESSAYFSSQAFLDHMGSIQERYPSPP